MNAYEEINNRIISEIEKAIAHGDVAPWAKGWISNGKNGCYNYCNNKSYSVLNQLLLGREGAWATFKQWNKAGGKIKKGESGSSVYFWQPVKTKVNEDGEIEKTFPVLKRYIVFHQDQVDGIDFDTETETETYEHDVFEAAENIIRDYTERECIKFITGENQAYYAPSLDEVHVPSLSQFERKEEYYGTSFHELAHSTGAKGRLDRISKKAFFGNEEYSKEELVAEISSAILLNTIGIDTEKSFNNSVSYLMSWLEVLKRDTKMIVSACSAADKAVEFILK